MEKSEVRTIGARKIETLLTALLIRANHVVSADQLVAEMWEGHVPRRSTASLHVNVSQLRKTVRRPGQDSPIVTRAAGYSLTLGDDELDLAEFQQLMRQAWTSAHARRHADAAAACERALGLWRGESDACFFGGPIANGFWAWFDESRLECLELMVESQLMLGRHRELVGLLFRLVAEHPLRESFHRQLMLALYRSERQADALRVYQVARDTLRRELGLEPCRALHEVHRAILAADVQLELLSAV
ncbi:AfsR/SARP family transcriptional regulator [Streptomyces sp. NRRL F-525]|uniref:AfsR/SARP family transcriptional regulator n=1 Tax=Streptomyces sp. NRRL F-525 TaxID=1463861 RepID=UPI000A8F0144|nr:AfsR/SARP family transcriptional regulator [Streptomyces sp. NRRL F-525]